MEIDRMAYIFGSFSRRVGSMKRRSAESSKSRDKLNSSTQSNVKIDQPSSPKIRHFNLEDNKFKCRICKQLFNDPRVLPCLHTFCLKCIEELVANDSQTEASEGSFRSASTSSDKPPSSASASASGSAGSGYVSSDRQSGSKYGNRINCPTCTTRVELSLTGGASSLPPNYPLSSKITAAAFNTSNGDVVGPCDLCFSEVTAISRCLNCVTNLCRQCEEQHFSQKTTNGHKVISLAATHNQTTRKNSSQVMCAEHPTVAISLFCTSCFEVSCTDCIRLYHKGHPYEAITKVAKSYTSDLRRTAEKAKAIVEKTAMAATKLNAASKQVEAHCGKVHSEVDRFIEDYVKAVMEHRDRLMRQVTETKEDKLRTIGDNRIYLQRRLQEARDLVDFLDELFTESGDVEVLTFLKPVLLKLQKCQDDGNIGAVNYSESLQFLPDEATHCEDSICPLYGVVTTQTVWPKHCWLNIKDLQNLEVGKRAAIILETRDKGDVKLDRGGEKVLAEVRYRDAGVIRSFTPSVEDRRDGTYCISFIPDVPGKLMLNISVKGQPVKDNPFPFTVRTVKPHHGAYHCCSFCSSGGSKEANCGCGGKMPGGYKGCGHGHQGHPGRRHWSCCGNVLEHSECTRGDGNKVSRYQFSL